MRSLASAERKALRAKAHALHPVVAIGHHGLTPAVVHEIDVALRAHELIKIRVFSDDRSERTALHERICAELDAAPVQHIGKLLIVWRPAPPPDPTGARPERSPRAKRARPQPGGRRPGGDARTTASGAPKPRGHGTAADAAARRRRAGRPKPPDALIAKTAGRGRPRGRAGVAAHDVASTPTRGPQARRRKAR